MAGDKVQAFGEVATEYDRVRPGYPVELIEDMLRYSAPATALEIGAGTGKATVAVASRGVQIVALEPDPAMALVLRQHVAGLAVNIAMGTLESYEPEEPVDLVYSAQAFHWTAPETRWTRTAAALRPGGSLALFWNLERLADAAVRNAAAGIMGDYEIKAWSEWPESDVVEPNPELTARPEYAEFRQQLYRWERTLPREDHLANLSTQSQFRMLEDEDRDELLDKLRDVLPDPISIEVATELYLAKRV
ncbi:class I SAM-dependent methyltransferase [Streptomyces sp. SID13031]|uniref:class I SAM-dependent methyltransferase n=1 Tax=Streptomyces sp. SID13031 TaxID=2706046 RepID=UPI0013CB948E|nr:class I SAM-dependent methyltransferase [Streptomyces sp. SID13031]NEA35221.1 class I SAM-dependent methyltransferase [Streptomyces sp. SID13031]